MAPARSEYLDRRENVLAPGNSGTGKTHLALVLGPAACQKRYRVRFTTSEALVNKLLETRNERRSAGRLTHHVRILEMNGES